MKWMILKKTTDSAKVVDDSKVENIPDEDPSKKENDEALSEDKIKDVAGNEIKEQENQNTGKAYGTNTAADKENLPIVKVLDNIIVSKQIPRQKPKSGKFWKEGRQQFRQIKRDKGKKFTFEQRMKNKEEKLKKEELRKKIEENKARKLENEKKSEQFQIIKNPAKIKRMKKKQLRLLEKRDIVTV